MMPVDVTSFWGCSFVIDVWLQKTIDKSIETDYNKNITIMSGVRDRPVDRPATCLVGKVLKSDRWYEILGMLSHPPETMGVIFSASFYGQSPKGRFFYAQIFTIIPHRQNLCVSCK